MSTITTPTTPAKSRRPLGEQFFLPGMSWEFYEHLLKELRNRHIRVTYDRGDVELMSPFYRPGRYSDILGLMVRVIAEELDVPIKGAGSTTFRRQTLERGLEPDECFYIAHVADILGKDDLNLDVDPPPDLAIEVDVTSLSIERIPIYAALGFPEVWRFDGERLWVYQLQSSGTYGEPQNQSAIFPSIPLAGLIEFANRSHETDDATFFREFRAWVKTVISENSKDS